MSGLENSEEIVIFRVQRVYSQVLENGVSSVGFMRKIYYIIQKANDKRLRVSFSYSKKKESNEEERKEEILISHDIAAFIQWDIMQT